MERYNVYHRFQRDPPPWRGDYSALKTERGKTVLKRRVKPRIRWGRFLVVLFFFFFALSAFFGFFTSVILGRVTLVQGVLTLMPAAGFLSESNILVLGIDATPGVQRSDAIMVVHVDPGKKGVGVVSIPRDTLAVIPRFGLDKINHAYARGGVELARQAVSSFLNVSIPYYVKINILGLESVVDKLGGVEIEVEKRMYYVDYSQNLWVDLKPGLQRLNGREAMGYVRFRSDAEGDAGRVARQHRFLRAILAEFLSPRNLLKIPLLLGEFMANIETNLDSKEILGVAVNLKEAYGLGQIEMTTLPGAGDLIDGIYYFKIDPEGAERIVQKLLKGSRKGAPNTSEIS